MGWLTFLVLILFGTFLGALKPLKFLLTLRQGLRLESCKPRRRLRNKEHRLVRTVNLNTGRTSCCDLERRSDRDKIIRVRRRSLTVIREELVGLGDLDTVRVAETVAGSAGQGSLCICWRVACSGGQENSFFCCRPENTPVSEFIKFKNNKNCKWTESLL